MSDIDTFRSETRAWLEANCPESMRWGGRAGNPALADDLVWGGKKETFPNPDAKLWLDRMAAKGWTAPTWPKDCGGAGLSKEEAKDTVPITSRDHNTPIDTFPRMLDADVHNVDPSTLFPTRSLPLYPTSPILEPTTVTLADPLAAPFVTTTLLTPVPSNVTLKLMLPTCIPTLPTTRRSYNTPLLDFTRTLLSHLHPVDSSTLPPTRINPL